MSEELNKIYNPSNVEEKWYQKWEDDNVFQPANKKNTESFTIMIPPPNVTGILHIGHILNNTIQDVLIRRARMMGKNTLWLPGTDHASIATESKVTKMLLDKGMKIDKTAELLLLDSLGTDLSKISNAINKLANIVSDNHGP